MRQEGHRHGELGYLDITKPSSLSKNRRREAMAIARGGGAGGGE